MQNAYVPGDWLPENLADEVRTWRDLNFPPASIGEMWDLALEIIGPIYNERLAAILPTKLPAGLRIGGPYECPLPRTPEFLLWGRGELEEYARQAADERVDLEAKATLDSWASGWSTAVVTGNAGASESHDAAAAILRAALLELADESAAIRCVKFWVGIGGSRMVALPPSWSDVKTLLQERPDWLNVGFNAMLDRGEVPPPWLTAAIT